MDCEGSEFLQLGQFSQLGEVFEVVTVKVETPQLWHFLEVIIHENQEVVRQINPFQVQDAGKDALDDGEELFDG